jgi:calcineurin-like phosphoesterase family protein
MDKINITLKPGETIWFTSDSHFGHRNILKFKPTSRPFEDEKDMAEALIERWNSVISPTDVIFHLGDFSWWNDRHGIKRLINKLNGKIYFVPGNHDDPGRQFELCDPEKIHVLSDVVYLYIRPEKDKASDPRFEYNCYEVVLSHFPQLCYSHSERKNVYNFFGHIHSEKNEPMLEFGKPIKLIPRHQYDVGCDRHDLTPVELFNVFKEIDEYPYWDIHH